MSPQTLRRIAIAALVTITLTAAWLMPRHPVLGGLLFGLVLLAGWFQLRALADARRVNAAGLACDVKALLALAGTPDKSLSPLAIIASIQHGAYDRVPTSLCDCGHCKKDAISIELEAMRRVAWLSWTGSAEQAWQLARDHLAQAQPNPVLAAFASYARLINLLVSYGAYVESQGSDSVDEEPAWVSGVAADVGRDWPSVRWPVFLAAARVAAARGDFETVKYYVSGIPPWPEDSPLEQVRRTLQELAEHRGHAS